ncbi:MFS transporter [Novosphingobium sp. 1949]|uniref:MFS transporter n=1 Tax=Novosphingobium organovorum TaxID=2930092 RepID=A0ABT0BC90_9SPHN|nr:MFS transporter [Novosphingobium organovorum]MCJ2182444.1 MFS transporter [Novosphingobium organovorum]
MTAPLAPTAAQPAPYTPVTPKGLRTSRMVTAICWFALVCEGYDLGSLGAVLPRMLVYKPWSLTPTMAGAMASAALAGAFFGGYLLGMFGDRFGRKPAFLICLTVFSAATGLAAFAASPLEFAFWRFIAGVGIGGIVPASSSLTTEFAPRGQANKAFAIMFSGYSLGIFGSAVMSYFIVLDFGWRMVFAIGALPLLLVPIFAWLLPESLNFLQSAGRHGTAQALSAKLGVPMPEPETAPDTGAEPKAGLRALFARGNALATTGFWLATFMDMILVYGLNTWLPEIMRAAGYDLGPSILFLGVFALASAVGGVLLGAIADRVGRRLTIIASFTMGAVMIVLLAFPWPLPVTYAIVGLAGIGSVSAAVLVTSYLAAYFSARLRATAVGTCISFSRFGAVCGPMMGAMIAQYHLPTAWNFLFFALAALLAGASILLVPPRHGVKG